MRIAENLLLIGVGLVLALEKLAILHLDRKMPVEFFIVERGGGGHGAEKIRRDLGHGASHAGFGECPENLRVTETAGFRAQIPVVCCRGN